MTLDPQAAAFLDLIKSGGTPPLKMMTPEESRALFAQMHALGGEIEAVAQVEDRHISVPDGQIKVRIYRPEGEGPFPILVFFHGGGYVFGDLETVDRPCRNLTNAARSVVVSVDYRLSPEYKFPVPVEDGYAALEWVSNQASTFQGDASRIAVGGDSAGGNLAAVVAILAQERGGPTIVSQVLLYPVTDFSCNSNSYKENGQGYNLTEEDMLWFRKHYLGSEDDIQNVYVSPLLANSLSGLPPALILTAQYDPLRDEGAQYAARLKDSGVSVEYECYEGMIHGFFWFAGILDQGKHAIDRVANYLRTVSGR
ncbi:alpha/beta hydrolase [Paenibacillus validus]|uniref:Alpha/beta hydrolase fold domain-containing protein n=1 Tax=Paenibacillus validus TaxID=44253 RepID=A0A7X2ZDL0_9BACL|nr:alpha/beta hydrolase [Paenibacillus validus]MUG72293.1 alpha/beta hydrolase fold domain-containing protein [Paenibacillus validus]